MLRQAGQGRPTSCEGGGGEAGGGFGRVCLALLGGQLGVIDLGEESAVLYPSEEFLQSFLRFRRFNAGIPASERLSTMRQALGFFNDAGFFGSQLLLLFRRVGFLQVYFVSYLF